MSFGNDSLFGAGVVISNKSTTTYNYVPMTSWIPTTGITKIRIALELRSKAGSVEVIRAYQTSNDGNTIIGTTDVGSAVSTEGLDYPPTLTDVSSNMAAAQMVRFCVGCKQTSGTDLNGAWAGIRVELVSC